MKITRISKEKPQNDDTTSIGFKEFEELKNKFEEEIKQKLIDCDKKANSGKLIVNDTNNVTLCGDCCLEFFYYYDVDGSYRNGIWINVKNSNNLDIWIRVHNASNGKKINVFSEYNLNCCNLNFIKSYALPKDFSKNGIWMSDKGKQVIEKKWDSILDEICIILPYLCNAKN